MMKIAHPIDPDGVEAAKRRFIHLASEVDPMTPVRKHPILAMGTAATLGAVAGSPSIEKSLLLTKAIDKLMMTTVPMLNQFIRGALQAMAHKQTNQDQTGKTT